MKRAAYSLVPSTRRTRVSILGGALLAIPSAAAILREVWVREADAS